MLDPRRANTTRDLLIRGPWIEMIIDGKETWEIQGSSTKLRGRIALIRAGSSQVVGTCEIVNAIA